jgi:hypothetical protein
MRPGAAPAAAGIRKDRHWNEKGHPMETPLAERIAADPNYQTLKSTRLRFG